MYLDGLGLIVIFFIVACTGICNFSLSLPNGGLVYNSSSSCSSIVPSGEQLWFGCEQGLNRGGLDPMVTTCQEDGLWYPDPSEVVCQSERFIYYNIIKKNSIAIIDM
jgi:hypothetical protein